MHNNGIYNNYANFDKKKLLTVMQNNIKTCDTQIKENVYKIIPEFI